MAELGMNSYLAVACGSGERSHDGHHIEYKGNADAKPHRAR